MICAVSQLRGATLSTPHWFFSLYLYAETVLRYAHYLRSFFSKFDVKREGFTPCFVLLLSWASLESQTFSQPCRVCKHTNNQ
jgi:hypothetical protein